MKTFFIATVTCLAVINSASAVTIADFEDEDGIQGPNQTYGLVGTTESEFFDLLVGSGTASAPEGDRFLSLDNRQGVSADQFSSQLGVSSEDFDASRASASLFTIEAEAGQNLEFFYYFGAFQDGGNPVVDSDRGLFVVDNTLFLLGDDLSTPATHTTFSEYSYEFQTSGTKTFGFVSTENLDEEGGSAYGRADGDLYGASLLIDGVRLVPEPAAGALILPIALMMRRRRPAY